MFSRMHCDNIIVLFLFRVIQLANVLISMKYRTDQRIYTSLSKITNSRKTSISQLKNA